MYLPKLLKCNVGYSWVQSDRNGGAACIVGDHDGKPLFHSRRAFSGHQSASEAELQTLIWTTLAIQDLRIKYVVTESSFSTELELLLKPSDFPSLAV